MSVSERSIVSGKVLIKRFFVCAPTMFPFAKRVCSLSLSVHRIHRLLDLPIVEHAAVHPSDKTINYRLNNASFAASKAPLCLRLEIHNQTNLCPRIVSPSGFFKLDEYEVQHIRNVSLCLDQYDGYCGKSVPVATSKYPLVSDHEMDFVSAFPRAQCIG